MWGQIQARRGRKRQPYLWASLKTPGIGSLSHASASCERQLPVLGWCPGCLPRHLLAVLRPYESVVTFVSSLHSTFPLGSGSLPLPVPWSPALHFPTSCWGLDTEARTFWICQGSCSKGQTTCHTFQSLPLPRGICAVLQIKFLTVQPLSPWLREWPLLAGVCSSCTVCFVAILTLGDPPLWPWGMVVGRHKEFLPQPRMAACEG